MTVERILFASTHGVLDPSSGAALATRDLLDLLGERGVACRAVTSGVLDYEAPTPAEAVLGGLDVPWRRATVPLGPGGAAEVLEVDAGGLHVTIVPTRTSRADAAPDLAEARAWLAAAEQALDAFRPDVLLTYGGHPASLELMRRARARGVTVVFHLHNFAYRDRSAFAHADAVLVPSEYARRSYARALGLEAMAIPYPLRPSRVLATDPAPRYVTFVNPQPAKGAAVVARIALELGRRRPEIPLLVVEGRGGAAGLAGPGLDLSGLANLHAMANTPDPRDFYRVSRAVLVPSLWRETFGRVAAEALANGLPVLASDRGALPGTLGDAGVCLHVPGRVGPDGLEAPTAREVAPWVATLERLWDDPEFAARHADRARAEAARWDDAVLAARYLEFFAGCRDRGLS
jgi:glycosyltransferase involved in cell wall biosynthesis